MTLIKSTSKFLSYRFNDSLMQFTKGNQKPHDSNEESKSWSWVQKRTQGTSYAGQRAKGFQTVCWELILIHEFIVPYRIFPSEIHIGIQPISNYKLSL